MRKDSTFVRVDYQTYYEISDAVKKGKTIEIIMVGKKSIYLKEDK